MSKLNYTNDDLLKSIKLGCMIPISQIALTDEDILFLASEELTSDVLATILKAREEYNVYVDTQDKNDSNVYPIPSRASGSRFRVVFLRDQNHNLHRCAETQVTQVPLLNDYGYSENYGIPMFYVQNDKIIFLNNTEQNIDGNQIEIHYYLDPSELVMVDQCLTIRSINTTTGIIEVNERQIPSTYKINTKLDFVQHKPQNIVKQMDITLVSVSSNTPISSIKFITVDPNEIPADLEVGDFIAIAGQSPVPQLVANLRPLLAQATICRILESQGDRDNIDVARKKLDKQVKLASAFIQDRTEGNPKKIVNRTGMMRASLIGFNGRRSRGG